MFANGETNLCLHGFAPRRELGVESGAAKRQKELEEINGKLHIKRELRDMATEEEYMRTFLEEEKV